MGNKEVPAKTLEEQLLVFQEKALRRSWHVGEWWFSVVDVCGVLTGRADAGAYWRKLKQRLGAKGSKPVTLCHGLKLETSDGKQRISAVSFVKEKYG